MSQFTVVMSDKEKGRTYVLLSLKNQINDNNYFSYTKHGKTEATR